MKACIITLVLIFTSLPAVSSCLFTLLPAPEALTQLARLRILLDQSHPDDLVALTLEPEYRKKEIELKAKFNLSEVEFRNLLVAEIERIQDESKSGSKSEESQKIRDAILKRAVVDGTTAVFHPIEPGTYSWNNFGPAHGSVEEPFAMMATHVTQVIWRDIVRLAQTEYPTKYDRLPESPSLHEGLTQPVTRVSPTQILLWLEALNELAGDAHPGLSKIIFGHKPGDFYRLPTSNEWIYVGVLLGVDKLSAQEQQAFFWGPNDQINEPRAVGSKPPVAFDDYEFDSYMGNVATLTLTPVNGNNPELKLLGGNYREDLIFRNSRSMDSFAQWPSAGFRLVRIEGGTKQ